MGSIMFTLYGHDGPVTACNFSAWGDYFATGGRDMVVNVWKSNLDSNGDTDTLEDVTGLISVGGLKDSILKSNRETYLVTDYDDKVRPAGRRSPSKGRLATQASVATNLGQGNVLKSDPSKSDLLSSKKYSYDELHEKAPEEEFYRQPSKIEWIPESAFSKASLENVPNEVSSIVSKIVNQLDMLTNMLQLLDQRVASNENQAKEALQFFKGFNQKNDHDDLSSHRQRDDGKALFISKIP